MKKPLLITSALLTLIAAIYTGAWFYTKAKIELAVKNSVNGIESLENISYITYKLDISCFPFLCINLTDLNAKMTDEKLRSKNGYSLQALKDNTLTLKLTNIFSNKINFEQSQLEFDLALTNLDNKISTKLLLNADQVLINLNRNSTSVLFNKADIQSSIGNQPLKILATTDLLTTNLEYSKEKNALAFGYNIQGLKIFEPNSSLLLADIKTSSLTAGFANISQNLINYAKANKNTYKTILNNLDEIINNKTAFKIAKFDINASGFETQSKAQLNINEKKQLEVNLDMSYKPLQKNHLLETVIKNYGIGQSEDGIYYLNIRTNDDFITINKDIKLPAISFK